MKKRYTNEQIAYAMRQHESGVAVQEICRTMSISEPTFYNWKRKYAGMGISELKKMKILEDEKGKLKKLVADLSLDKHILQEVIAKKFSEPRTGRA